MLPDLVEMLQQTLTIEPFAGESPTGAITWGPAVTYAPSLPTNGARVTFRPKRIRTPLGEELVARAEVWLDAPGGVFPTITERDRVTLDDGSQPPMLSIDKVVDETGVPEYVKLYLG